MTGDTPRVLTAALYPVRGTSQARVILLWRTPALHDYDHHDAAAQRRLIHNMYGDMGWELPRLLASWRTQTTCTLTRSARS
jgi:hypothetical protein